MIEGSSRLSLLPATSDVDHEATVISKDPSDLTGKPEEPRDVVVRIDVAVWLLATKCKWRGGNDQIH